MNPSALFGLLVLIGLAFYVVRALKMPEIVQVVLVIISVLMMLRFFGMLG